MTLIKYKNFFKKLEKNETDTKMTNELVWFEWSEETSLSWITQ